MKYLRVAHGLAMLGSAACVANEAPTTDAPSLGHHESAIAKGTDDYGRENVVLIHLLTTNELCTGALVADRVVLTAKHCVQKPGAAAPLALTELRVLTGYSPFTQPTGEYRAESITTTEGAPKTWDEIVGSDLALITLDRSTGIEPVPLDLTSPAGEQGKTATVVGYGDSDERDYNGVRLSRTVVVGEINEREIRIDDAVCSGDSGGPLLNEAGETFGLASTGPALPCGIAETYYQRLDLYRELILETIAAAETCGLGDRPCDADGGSDDSTGEPKGDLDDSSDAGAQDAKDAATDLEDEGAAESPSNAGCGVAPTSRSGWAAGAWIAVAVLGMRTRRWPQCLRRRRPRSLC